jgi:hypothetical protein
MARCLRVGPNADVHYGGLIELSALQSTLVTECFCQPTWPVRQAEEHQSTCCKMLIGLVRN